MAVLKFPQDFIDRTSTATKVLVADASGNNGYADYGRFSGHVGIGTLSPIVRLQVTHNSTAQPVAYIYNPNNTAGSSRGILVEGGTNSSDYSALFRNAVGVDLFIVKGDGNSQFFGNVVASGTITPGSDSRLKKAVKKLPSALESVLSLNPVSYKLRMDNANSLGFIADEVREIFPELIIEGQDKEKMLAMNYMGLTAPIVKAMQEMHEIIVGLKSEIEELKAGK